jgi:purine-binding chemotaxis protein CheW
MMEQPSRTGAEIDDALVSSFFIGDTLFGFDTVKVQEVVRVSNVTPVHHAPPFVRGVMNLRGRIVTVVDLATRLGLGSVDVNEESRTYIVEWKQEHLGLLVDRTSDVVSFDRGAIKPPPENVRGVSGAMLEGMCQAGGRLVALLNLEAMLDDSDRGLGRSTPAGTAERA